MFIISNDNKAAVNVSFIAAFQIIDKDKDGDFELYAYDTSIYYHQKDERAYMNGYLLFSSEDKQKCIALRDELIARIHDRSHTASIRVDEILKTLEN